MKFIVALVFLLLGGGALATPPVIVDCASKRCPQAVFDSRLPQIEGTLVILHSDDFAAGTGQFLYHVHEDSGVATGLNVTTLPRELKGGMRIRVQGTRTAMRSTDGQVTAPTMTPSTIIIITKPPSASAMRGMVQAVTSNSVLVILANFSNTNDTSLSRWQAEQVMTSNPGSVANYYSEVSYGQQTLNVTVTDWVTMNQQADCNFNTIGLNAEAAARTANPVWDAANYNFVVYLFSNQPCGWKGLAYVGFPHKAWINGSGSFVTQVIAHEMGHNFGLLHAGSLNCGAQPIDGNCSATEYGDAWDTMGNQRAGHLNAAQKLDLGWIPASAVKTHTAGTLTYNIDPLELPGGAIYAVKIPTANPNRTYWLEYRQPVGFDAGVADAVQVRVAYPFEWALGADDTEILNVSLPDGQSYLDSTYAINVTVGIGGPLPPPPPPGGASPLGTTVPPAASITDDKGAVWTIDNIGEVRRNGTRAGGFFAKQLAWQLEARNGSKPSLAATNKDNGSVSFWNGSGWAWAGR